jgi:hypothetical protein
MKLPVSATCPNTCFNETPRIPVQLFHMIAAQQEEADLNAAIAASLMDTGGPFASYDADQEYSDSQDAPAANQLGAKIITKKKLS